jgi:hypothetical protein
VLFLNRKRFWYSKSLIELNPTDQQESTALVHMSIYGFPRLLGRHMLISFLLQPRGSPFSERRKQGAILGCTNGSSLNASLEYVLAPRESRYYYYKCPRASEASIFSSNPDSQAWSLNRSAVQAASLSSTRIPNIKVGLGVHFGVTGSRSAILPSCKHRH